MSSNIWKRIQIGSTLILLSLLCFSHLALALGDSENEAEADLLHRHIRDVQVRLVPVPNLVPENVSNDVTLYNVSLIAPNRNYIVTNSSAGVNSMFQVTSGLLKLRSTLPADQRKLFDYEKFKTFDVTITCTNQTDPTDVIILTVRLALSDVNDEPPVFTNKPKPFLATVVANPSPGTVVFTVTVIDPDTNANIIFGIDEVTYQGQTITGRFQYNLLDGGNSARKTYNIITAGSGALTQGAEYNIKITAQDMNTATGQQLTTENIYVLVGNRPPQFFEQSYKGRIYENTQTTPTNWVLEMDSNNKLLIRVMQFQPGNQLTYQLLDQGNRPSQLFDIQPEDNAQRIVNRMALDYETITFVSLIIKVTEAGTGLTSTVSINIIIIDENDHSPTFFAPQYTATIREDVLNGTSVLTVTATDLDSGPYGEIIFSILNSTSFDVTTSNTNKTYFGTVIVKSLLDFDSDPRPRQFSVIASDKGTPALSTSVQTTVFLQNVNDNPPTIVNTTSTFYLNETSQVNTIVTLIQASDIDGDSFQFYFERKSATSDIFTIRPTNGQIILNSAIPKDINSYILIVIAVDEDNCCGNIKTGPKTATATFTVNIVDINVNKPSFNNCLSYDTASVKEMSPAGTPVIQVSAFDPDRGQNGVVLYRIETPEANTDRDVFQINSTTGEITVKRSVSRDNYNVIQLTVVGRNPPSFPLMEGRCTFRVTILDINNNPPTFSQALYTIPLSFSTKPPYIVTQMAASDKDVGDNANITYSFGMNDTVALRTFSIHPLSGVIQLNQTLNQSIPSYILIVVANDNGKDPGPLTGNTTVNVTISFDQRQPPVWLDSAPDNAAYDVSEDSPRGYVITTLACQSNLSNTGVEFRVFDAGDTIISESKNFYIVTFTDNGVSKMNLSLRNSLDYETTKKYTLSIVCQSLSADVLRARLLTRVINVLDANDEVPEFLGLDANGRYRGTVAEDAKAGATVLQISAQDNDNTPEYRTVSFTLGSEFKDFFQVNPLGNNRADIVTTSLLKLDRENVSQYTVEIVAQDGAPSSLSDSNQPNKVSRFIDVIVTDVNDNPPRFDQLVYIFNVSENAPVSYSVGVVKAFDPDEIDQGLGLDYRFTSGNKFNAFNIIPITGEIRLAKKLDYDNPQEEKEYSLTLIAVDSLQLHTATTTVEIFINDENDNRPIFSKNPYRVENKVTEEDTSITPQNPLFLVQVNATDADVARPNAIRYSLFNPAQSNVYQFFTVDAKSGNVSLIGPLDRDIPPYFYTITVKAEDEIVNPLSNFADVLVYPLDINDNDPEFNPQYLQNAVREHTANVYVMTLSATDKDNGVNGTVHYKLAPDQPDATLASMFEVRQSGEIYTTNNVTLLDRETIEFVYLAVVAYDLGTPSRFNSATATISLIDINDQPPFFEKPFYSVSVSEHLTSGRILTISAKDLDSDPKNREMIFSLETSSATKFFTVESIGTDAVISVTQVQVFDKKFQKTVTSTVSIIVQLITDETVRKSGGVRLEGITADEFVKPTKTTPSTSRYTQFREAVSKMLGYPSLESIEIVSLTEGEGFLDVWFSAHASPYVSPSQGESAVMLNKAEFEQAVGLKVLQVPINLCMEENSDIGCYNLFNVTGQPELVNSNGTSYVMMRTTLAPEEGCVDGMFPDPIECRGDYCFNGGTCIKDDWGKLSCACSPGFDGPRCQQLHHSFDGTSATFYKGLSACAEGRTSIDFVTVQEDGLIMYSGPVSAVNQNEDALDYLILELKAGYPFLRLNLGGQEVSLELNGKNVAGTVKMQKLSDGVWHHLDIDRDNQRVTLTVDHCDTAAVANGTVSDWSPCRISGVVPGPDVLLNVKSLLQLGGRYTTDPAYPSGITSKGFNGCLKNLKHNTKLYDLYYKELPSWKSGNNGCPREETICGQGTAQPVCGQNATCEANWQTSKVVSCRCYPGWYGTKCAKVAPTKDLRTDSFFAWQLTQVLINDALRKASFQMMYRTRQITGTLFVLTNAEFKKIVLELVNGKLSLSYNMGQGDVSVVLTDAPANTGQWATVRVERYGNEFLLILDGGEGRYYAYQTAQTNLGVLFEVQPLVIVGAQVTSGKTSNDLASTCVRDIRFNDYWLPLTQDQNSDPDAGARLTESRGIQEGCVRDDCGPSVTCRPGTYCYPLWEAHACRCTAVGTSLVNDVCVATCVPNPCYNYGVCSVVSGKPVCMCPAGWGGPLCETQAQVNPDDAGLGAGAIAGIVIAILVLLILLILLLCFLLTRKRSEKEKFIEVDPDDDYIRENVMFYDEEGAGEEDHAAYDLRLLQRPVKETDAKPVFSPVTESEMRARNAPRVDRPDIAPRSDRPDVGTFIKDRINEAENDDPLNDSTREYNFEGGNSDAGSLSSLNTSSSGGSQDYDYLSDWGPKFAKLADMYGAGQNLDDV